MSLITGQHLIEAGWQPGPRFSDLLEAAAAFEAKGIHDPAYLIKLLERDFGKEDLKVKLRDKSLSFSEAIEATCELDEKNIAAVRRFMGQLL
ncbi:MAG TPA: RtcB family protein, partial [Verrucomicrobiales bacterium]|nr:RtcB family protein [Verrucomicrobiales bacterium]